MDFFKFIIYFERERESTRVREPGRGRERERERERILRRFHTVSMEHNLGLEPMNREIMTCTEIKSQMLN